MKASRQFIPVLGLVATILTSGLMVARLDAQDTNPARDLTNAASAEVRNSKGEILLSGQFMLVEEDDDDVERKAVLQRTGVDPDASGEAEIEYSRSSPVFQEVEFSVRNVSPGEVLSFAIDGTQIGTRTANRRGHAEFEIDIPMPGTSAAR